MSADIAAADSSWRAGRWGRGLIGSDRWARWTGSRAWPPTVAYGIPVALAAIAVQLWFRTGGLLASGDLAPPIVPGNDYLSHWNDTGDGAGGPSFTIVSLPYSEGLRLFHALGLGEVAFQRVWLTILVTGAAAAVVFLARSLFANPVAGMVAGVVSTFNAYRLVVGFDWVPVAAIVAAALLGGLVLRRGRSAAGPPAVVFALASLLLGPVFVNPPHVVLVLAWVAVCVLLAWAGYGASALGRIGRFLLRAGPLAFVFNLWWIVPAYLTVTGSVFAQQFSAPGVGNWAWTHQRASIWNVLSLTSSWAWLQPQYYPISHGLERLPFSVLKFAPVVVAVLAVILARKRTRGASYVLAAAGILAVFVIKGLHPPAGSANLWLYHHLPGFWLFRDPGKVGLILVLVYSLLAALAVVELRRRSAAAGAAAAAVIVVAAVGYAHPLLTGGLIAGKRPLLPPAHVHVPAGWRAAAAYVDGVPEPGKAVVLPELDYYQAPTTWGYYGASFLHQLFRRSVIEPLPGGYYSDPVVTQLVGELEQELLDRRGDVRPVLRALGTRYVLLRRDLDPRFPGRTFVAPSKLAPALARADGLRHVRSFGVVDLYETTASPAAEVYPAVPLVVHGTTGSSLYGALDVGPTAALVTPRETASLAGLAPGNVTLVPIPGSPGAQSRGVVMHFPPLRAQVQVTIGHRSFPVPAGPSRSRSFPFSQSTAPTIYRFLPSDRVKAIPFLPSLARRVGDCNAYDSMTAGEAGLTASVQGGILRLGAMHHAACVAIRIRNLTPRAPVRLHLAYRAVSGNPPRLCLWQLGPNECAALPALASTHRWRTFDATAALAPGARSTWLFLYADGDAPGPTATEYRNLRVDLPQAAIAVSVSPVVRLPHVQYERITPYEARVHVQGATRPFLLVLGETFASGWRLDGSPKAGHVVVNGYANGWKVSRLGSYDLKLSYAPERWAIWARHGDAVLIPAVLVFSLLGIGRRRVRVPFSAPRRAGPADRPQPTTLAARREPVQPAGEGERRPDVHGLELAQRVEHTRADLESEMEALRKRAGELRESMRSLLVDPRGEPSLTDELQSTIRTHEQTPAETE